MLGASCRAPCCAVADPRMMRRHKFVDGPVTLCANHSALAGRRQLLWRDFERDVLFEIDTRRGPALLATG